MEQSLQDKGSEHLESSKELPHLTSRFTQTCDRAGQQDHGQAKQLNCRIGKSRHNGKCGVTKEHHKQVPLRVRLEAKQKKGERPQEGYVSSAQPCRESCLDQEACGKEPDGKEAGQGSEDDHVSVGVTVLRCPTDNLEILLHRALSVRVRVAIERRHNDRRN